jgi:DNA-binding Lrp family transcriptional regulator
LSSRRIQKAFVLIKARTGQEKKLAEDLMKYSEVREVHIISGEWDIMAVLETERDIVVPSEERVLDVVMEKLAKNSNVRDTYTIIPHFSRFKT